MATDLCPVMAMIVRMSRPASSILVTKVCRRSWKRTSRTLARLQRLFQAVFVFRGEDQLITIGPQMLALMQDKSRSLAAFLDQDSDGAYDFMSYDVYDDEATRHVTVGDGDFDGQPDMRWINYWEEDRRVTEMLIAGCWYELAKGDRTPGIILDGEFYPLPEAKAKILGQSEEPVDSPEPATPE